MQANPAPSHHFHHPAGTYLAMVTTIVVSEQTLPSAKELFRGVMPILLLNNTT
jgi:hypothetical protein